MVDDAAASGDVPATPPPSAAAEAMDVAVTTPDGQQHAATADAFADGLFAPKKLGIKHRIPKRGRMPAEMSAVMAQKGYLPICWKEYPALTNK